MYALRKLYSFRFFLGNEFSHAGRNPYMTKMLGNRFAYNLIGWAVVRRRITGKKGQRTKKRKGQKHEEHPPFRWVSCGGDFYLGGCHVGVIFTLELGKF